MKASVVAVVVSTVVVAGLASADKKRPTHKPANAAAAPGFYKILVKPNAKWVLRETIDLDTSGHKANPRTITVETYDVRKVGDADVARLRWTLAERDGTTQNIGDSEAGKFTQVAVTTAGLYIFAAVADDKEIAKRLEGKPSRSDPPKAYSGTVQNSGRALEVTASGLVCMSQSDPKQTGPCEDTCFATMCLSATDGVVQLDGNWAPDTSIFAQKGYEDK
jgi:hypothetical protein